MTERNLAINKDSEIALLLKHHFCPAGKAVKKLILMLKMFVWLKYKLFFLFKFTTN